MVSTVAPPYMNIQQTLAEVRRVLVRGGSLSLILHAPGFTIAELLNIAGNGMRCYGIPKPILTLFRLYVLANGLVFHCTGKTIGFFGRRIESFQTERGMRLALRYAGFTNLSFSWRAGPVGEMLLAEVLKSTVLGVHSGSEVQLSNVVGVGAK